LIQNKNFKKLVTISLGLVLTLVILLFLITKVKTDSLRGILSTINIYFLFISIFLNVPVLLLMGLRWQYLLRIVGCNLRFKDVLKNIMMSTMFANILPGAGDFSRPLLIKYEHGGVGTRLVGATIFEKILDFVILASFSSYAALSFLELKYAMVLLSFLFVPVFFLFYERINKFFRKLRYIDYFFESFHNFYRLFINSRRILILSCISFIIWSIILIQMYFVFISIQNIPLIYIFTIGSISILVGSLPISIGGIGPREATLIFFLGKVGIIYDVAFSFGVLFSSVRIVLPAIIGALCIPFIKKSKAK